MPLLVMLFILVPIVELVLLIKVGSLIGLASTVAIVLLTAIVGAGLLRREGVSTLLRAQRRMEQGELPAEQLIEGALLAFGGALLLTPGFITDGVGMACLLPVCRRRLAREILARGSFRVVGAAVGQGPAPYRTAPGAPDGAAIIDGECERVD